MRATTSPRATPAFAGILAAALVAGTSAVASAQAPAPLRPPPGAHVVTISSPERMGNEPGIAVDPRDPRRVIAVYQGPAHAEYSTDGGRTFAPGAGTVPADWRVAGDVSVAFDTHGYAYLSSLVFDSLGTAYYWGHNATRNGLLVRRSRDGGRTWEQEPTLVAGFPTGLEGESRWEDMPRIFADNVPTSPFAGHLYLGWIEWRLKDSIILFSRSSDQGRTWSFPLRISTHAGLPRDDNGAVVGFTCAVAGDGSIYAAWNDGSTITLAISRDGGRSFRPSHAILQVGPPYFGVVPGVARVMGFPQVAVDARPERSGGGTVYVAWSDYRNGDIDVFLSRSTDRGYTWSAPVRVNTDAAHDGFDQFFQFLAVDPLTGDVYLQFYDRRADPANRATRMTLARSTDGGRSFVNYAWSETPFESHGAFLGDYTWLTAYAGKVYGVWTEATPLAPDAGAPSAPRRTEGTVVRVGTADFTKQ